LSGWLDSDTNAKIGFAFAVFICSWNFETLVGYEYEYGYEKLIKYVIKVFSWV
jgi:hypothetical protein